MKNELCTCQVISGGHLAPNATCPLHRPDPSHPDGSIGDPRLRWFLCAHPNEVIEAYAEDGSLHEAIASAIERLKAAAAPASPQLEVGIPLVEQVYGAAPAEPTQDAAKGAKNYNLREAALHRRAQMAESELEKTRRRYQDLQNAHDGILHRLDLAIQAREKYAAELRAALSPRTTDAPAGEQK